MMHVYVTRHIPGLDRLKDASVWTGDAPPPYETIIEGVAGAEGLLCMLTDRVDEGVFGAGHNLRVVSQMAVGVDNIDLGAATRRGIPVGHTPGVLAETTADLTWALILCLPRRVTEAERFLRDGRWSHWAPDLLLGRDVHGATLGIVGMGAIGRAVARRASGFGMRVIHSSRSGGMPLDDLLATADIVTLHCALTSETANLIGPRELGLMKPTAYLVNTSRGGVVDEEALAGALRSRTIAGAALDVYRTEPLPAGSPLLEVDNVVLVPHIGSASFATRERMAALAVDNLLAGLRGERLPHCANPEVYG